MAHRAFDIVEPGSRHRQQVDVDAHESFVDDVKPAFGQQMVDVGDAAVGRVLDRQHGVVDIAAPAKLDRILERRARHRFHSGARLPASLVRIGSGFPLKGDPSAHFGVSPAASARQRAFRRANYTLIPAGGSG